MGTQGPSVLDGEIIAEQNVFLVYDIAAINGNNQIAAKRFSERLQTIAKIINDVRQKIENHPDGGTGRIDLQAKLFVPQREIDRILKKIHVLPNGQHEFYDQGRNRRNKNDGLIFTADDDTYLQNQKENSLLKWKWLEHNTIDFKFIAPLWQSGDNELQFYCGGYRQQDIMIRKQKVSDEVRSMLDRDFRENNANELVYECQYDRYQSCWNVLHRRADKTDANFVTVVLATMETMVDNVTLEEIKSACEKYGK